MVDPTQKDRLNEAIAAEVRAQLARRRLSGVRAARALGWTQNYISRRISGAVPFTVADLDALADLLEVPVTTFFPQSRKTMGGLIFDKRSPVAGYGVAA